MPTDLLAMIPQFGVAGLIAWMWMVERRAATDRERQIAEAHDRVVAQARELDVLVRVVRDNTAALARLEATQRAVLDLIAARHAPAQPHEPRHALVT